MYSNDSLSWLNPESSDRSARGLSRSLRSYGPAVPGRIDRDGRTLINFAANDYLGLASDPRVIDAAHRSALQYGWGSGASALVSGWRTPHEELAHALADFEQSESVALFPTGFAANLGTIAALVARGDAVYLDRWNHACLIDGARLSGASVRVYPHNDADRLDAILRRERPRFRRVLIATDGVFSMDGDLAPLPDLVAIADRFDAMLLVDEAHGTGVFGPDGRGASSALGLSDRIPIRVGTLSKALGSLGGFVAGSARLTDHLINTARPLLYSTALPPAAAAAALEALTIARSEPWRRERVHSLGDSLRSSLRSLGWDVPPSTGPIVPLLLGEPETAVRLSDHLRSLGFLVPAIRPPTVPSGTSRLRFSLSAAHREEELEALLKAIGSAPGT